MCEDRTVAAAVLIALVLAHAFVYRFLLRLQGAEAALLRSAIWLGLLGATASLLFGVVVIDAIMRGKSGGGPPPVPPMASLPAIFLFETVLGNLLARRLSRPRESFLAWLAGTNIVISPLQAFAGVIAIDSIRLV